MRRSAHPTGSGDRGKIRIGTAQMYGLNHIGHPDSDHDERHMSRLRISPSNGSSEADNAASLPPPRCLGRRREIVPLSAMASDLGP